MRPNVFGCFRGRSGMGGGVSHPRRDHSYRHDPERPAQIFSGEGRCYVRSSAAHAIATGHDAVAPGQWTDLVTTTGESIRDPGSDGIEVEFRQRDVTAISKRQASMASMSGAESDCARFVSWHGTWIGRRLGMVCAKPLSCPGRRVAPSGWHRRRRTRLQEGGADARAATPRRGAGDHYRTVS